MKQHCYRVEKGKARYCVDVEDLRALLKGAKPLLKPPENWWNEKRDRVVYNAGYTALKRELLASLAVSSASASSTNANRKKGSGEGK